MFEYVTNCPVCQGQHFNIFKVCQDYSATQESFTIVSCQHCNFKFTNPRPTPDAISKYYDSNNYISHSNQNNSLINIVYKNIRKITVRQKANLIKEFSASGQLLDYGCGTGEFLHACKQQGWKIQGIEPADIARSQAQKLTGSSIYGSVFDTNFPDRFDMITLWHVLEHIPSLDATLKKLEQLLNPSGTILIALPNINSYDANYYDKYWAGYDVPRHLYHFEPDSIKQLLKIHHLKIVKIIPQKLDAYYVSLLSEKYKSKKNSYVKAIINGYKSNQYAKKNKSSYSSLIYIAKHV